MLRHRYERIPCTEHEDAGASLLPHHLTQHTCPPFQQFIQTCVALGEGPGHSCFPFQECIPPGVFCLQNFSVPAPPPTPRGKLKCFASNALKSFLCNLNNCNYFFNGVSQNRTCFLIRFSGDGISLFSVQMNKHRRVLCSCSRVSIYRLLRFIISIIVSAVLRTGPMVQHTLYTCSVTELSPY